MPRIAPLIVPLVVGSVVLGILTLVAVSCGPSRMAADDVSYPALERTVLLKDPAAAGIGRSISIPPQPALDGSLVDLASSPRGGVATVLAMTSVGCPVSAKYAPRLAALEAEYASRGVRFVYVNTVAAEQTAAMKDQARRAGFKGPYLPDRSRAVVGALSARTTAEVFVIDTSRTLVFRGAVDDQFGVGTALEQPTRNFLREALEATLATKPPAIAATSAPGCLIDIAEPRASTEAPDITYYGRIAEILDSSCTDCHRSGGPGPFSLTSPTLIDGRAAMIEAVVRDGLMPPSHGVASGSDKSPRWRRRHELPARDRDDLLTWIARGRPLGDPSLAPTPKPRPQGWAIGLPDLILMTPGIVVAPTEPLRHARFSVPTRIEGDQWITALEFKPVKPGTIHHALAWLLPPGTPPPAPDEFPQADFLGVYSPGSELIAYEPGVARRFPAGSTLLVDVYARPMATSGRMGASLRIGFRTTPIVAGGAQTTSQPTHELRSFTLQASPFTIPPNTPDFQLVVARTLAEPCTIVAITPYMRSRGRAATVEATTPPESSGAAESLTLFSGSRYDFRWTSRYEFFEPPVLPAGTRLTARGRHDNSRANVANPDPAATVQRGAEPADEALAVFVETLVPIGQ